MEVVKEAKDSSSFCSSSSSSSSSMLLQTKHKRTKGTKFFNKHGVTVASTKFPPRRSLFTFMCSRSSLTSHTFSLIGEFEKPILTCLHLIGRIFLSVCTVATNTLFGFLRPSEFNAMGLISGIGVDFERWRAKRCWSRSGRKEDEEDSCITETNLGGMGFPWKNIVILPLSTDF